MECARFVVEKSFKFDIIRQNFYTASHLKVFFHNIYPKRIISFIRTIGLTNKLWKSSGML